MKFASSLVKGKLIQRYKRFLADVELEDGRIITAHCAYSGSMIGLKDPGSTVYIQPISTGKLGFRWELIEVNNTLVSVNTMHPNKIAEEALTNKLIPAFAGYDVIRREVKYGNASRIDLLLESPNLPPCYVEVKTAALVRSEHAEFPDAVTERGTKHLNELMMMVQQGNRAAMLYIALRDDCKTFKLASDIDPEYTKTAAIAFAAGVEKYCYSCTVSTEEIKIASPMQILMS